MVSLLETFQTLCFCRCLRNRHDHLYTGMAERVIRSGNFSGSKKDTERDLDGVRVILCTLSMITSKSMIRSGFAQLVPIRALIVDEASQIEVGEYLPLLSQSASTLEKLVFIGDDKQRKFVVHMQIRAYCLTLVPF